MRIRPENTEYQARNIDELKKRWDDDRNFLLAEECNPFEFEFPTFANIVDVLRNDEDTRIRCWDHSIDDDAFAKEFRSMPIEQAMEAPFALAHFKLTHFTNRGGLLFGLWDGVMNPWTRFLARAGFTWFRCYPILFLSGSNMNGNYHMDSSHVVAWQIYGTKVFNGFVEPEEITPLAKVSDPDYRKSIQKPDPVDEDQVLGFVMSPGTVLWNQLLTPHWVNAGDDGKPALSLNISHGGLRCDGALSRRGEAIESRYQKHPDERF